MKVLHILDHYLPLFSGYTFRSSYILANQRSVLGVEPMVLTSLKQGETGNDVEDIDGQRIYRTRASAPGWSSLPVLREYWQMKTLERRILEIARKEKPAVLHAHSPVLNAWPAIWAGRRLGIPVVYEIRALWEDAGVDHRTTTEGSLRYIATRELETMACRRADEVVTICEGLRGVLEERGIRPDKLHVLPNGVDVRRFTPPPLDAALQTKLGFKGKKVLGFIGTLYRYEGISLLLKAVRSLVREDPDIRCLIVGGGYNDEAKELEALARDLGIAEHVVVHGKVPHQNIGSFYSIIDVLVYPRIRSRLLELVTPLKPLEAMSMEKLVVGSDVGGIKELIQDGENGLLFRADDVDDLTRVLSKALRDPETIQRIGKRGRRYVEENRPWAKLIQAHARVYAKVGAGA